jgi:hypothetical protein
MGRAIIKFTIILSILAFAAGNVASANPIGDFFKRLGNSIAHPQKKSRAHSKSSKQPASEEASTPPSPGPTGGPPSGQNIQAALAAPEVKGGKRDVPYAIPVPGRKGLVTSPFAPDAGYVDVSKFPPGTEVKDPFSGKIFRTP